MNCFECGVETDCIHNHHVVPKSLGGTKTIPLCEKCHGLIHQRHLTTSFLTRSALQKKKLQGKRVSGNPPYGFKFEGQLVIENKQEQDIIQLIKNLHDQKRGAPNITKILNKKRIPARGKKWWCSSVQKILKSLETCSDSSV
jgi:hypothetical protein